MIFKTKPLQGAAIVSAARSWQNTRSASDHLRVSDSSLWCIWQSGGGGVLVVGFQLMCHCQLRHNNTVMWVHIIAKC